MEDGAFRGHRTVSCSRVWWVGDECPTNFKQKQKKEEENKCS